MTSLLQRSPFQIVAPEPGHLQLGDIFLMLEDRVDRRFMPRARGNVRFSDRPPFVDTKHPVYDNFPHIQNRELTQLVRFNNGCNLSDCYCYLKLDPIQLLVNLRTQQALIRLTPDGVDMYWYDSSQEAVNIDVDKLMRELNSF